MKLINTYNYEEYIIDYIDGTLSQERYSEMEEFLHLNPTIKNEINEISKITLQKEPISFNAKENLYKDIDSKIYEEKCIAFIENQLSKEERNILEIEISVDYTKHTILEEYKKTILKADNNIIFKNKESLKQNSSFYFKRILNFSAAAIIITLFSISILIIPSYLEQPVEISKQNNSNKDYNNNNIENTVKNKSFATNTNNELNNNSIKEIKKVQNKVQKRIILVSKGNKLNTEPIIAEVYIDNLIASNEIPINNTSLNISNSTVIKMSNEISLNNNATVWNEENVEFKANTAKQKNILKKGGSIFRSIVGKYFYTKHISHSKEIIIE